MTTVPSPTAVAFLPDKRMLITSQAGTVRLYDETKPTGSRLTTALTFDTDNSGSDPKTCFTSEAGVLGIAVDPDFPTNNYVYIFYTARNGSNCGQPSYGNTTYSAVNQRVNRVSRFTFNTTSNTITPGSELTLVDRMPARGGNHNAGDVHFGKDGFLYISIGDGGTSWRSSGGGAGDNFAARDKNVLTGKILRITKTGGIPASNPFQGAGTGSCKDTGTHAGTDHCQETFAWGLRNPFRFAMDPNAAGTRFYINDV
ncbi:MAG: PQQ-dependent sugar dehydrogenase, partial [Casimicrobium sp.]